MFVRTNSFCILYSTLLQTRNAVDEILL